MKNNFTFFMDLPTKSFNDYLKFALSKDKYFNHFLVQAGVIALMDIVNAMQENFSKYVKDYIPLLLTILDDEDVNREVKLNVIVIIGEIAFNAQKGFLPYLRGTMEILLGACVLAVSISNDDNDFEEYLQRLRYKLVESFTLIFIGLDDCKETIQFTEYVRPILEFYKGLLFNNMIVTSVELNKAILGFVMDMFNSYGVEVKNIIEKDTIARLLFCLKESKVVKYVKYAEEVEGVSLKY
jgi:hypothetical protein